MKKHCLLIFLLFSGFHFLQAQNAMYVNSSNGLNMREGAGTNYDVSATIPNGYKVKVISKEEEWAKVTFEGKTGYVASQFLSETKPKQQRSSSHNSKKNKATSGSNSPDYGTPLWGIGLRLGDPTGVSAKKYLSDGKALEVNLGSTGYHGFDYRDDFYDRDQYKDYDYLSYEASGAITLQPIIFFKRISLTWRV